MSMPIQSLSSVQTSTLLHPKTLKHSSLQISSLRDSSPPGDLKPQNALLKPLS